VRLLEIQRQLSEDWRRRHRSNGSQSAGLVQALAVGVLLSEAKQLMSHGYFEEWVSAFCPFSVRSAARYLRVTKKWGSVPVGQGRAKSRFRSPCATMQSAERSFSAVQGPSVSLADQKALIRQRVDTEFPPQRRIEGVPLRLLRRSARHEARGAGASATRRQGNWL
jgi:hypothetical protein